MRLESWFFTKGTESGSCGQSREGWIVLICLKRNLSSCCSQQQTAPKKLKNQDPGSTELKTTTFQKYELINLPFGLFIFYCRVFFTVPPNFPVPKWKTRGTLKKIDVKDLLVGWRVFLVMYRKYGGTAKKHPVKCYGQNLKKCQCRASNTPMFGFRLFVLNVEYIHFH